MSDARLAQNVRIRRGLEGPQLIVEWDTPTEISPGMVIRVVRRLFEFAEHPDSGIVVFEGLAAAGYVADLNLDPCRCYYYTVLTHSFFPKDEWLFGPTVQVSTIAIPTGYFGRDGGLLRLLPEIYLLGDKLSDEDVEPREAAVFALQPVFDADAHEWFNLGENTDPTKEPKKKGPLARFLKSIALELDHVKGLIDCMPTLWDVDETCCDNLPALGTVIGLEVNRELPCSAQRQEIKEHVAILKARGTKVGIRARARTVSGLPVDIQEWCNNILLTNTQGRTVIAAPNPGLTSKFRLPGDDTDYTPGPGIGFFDICIFFRLACDDCLSEEVVKKLNRVMPAELPVCRIGSFAFVDCTFVEEAHLEPEETGVEDILEDAVAEEFVFQTCWLITNSLDDTQDPPSAGPSLVLGGARNLTNALRALTANPSIICAELFSDTIICSSRVRRARVGCSRVA